MAGVRKGRGRELGGETSRAQIPPSTQEAETGKILQWSLSFGTALFKGHTWDFRGVSNQHPQPLLFRSRRSWAAAAGVKGTRTP